tara:strand:- start:1648 stop:1764 length:117 start_codon:yes stop_codon:yes gene_type:complete
MKVVCILMCAINGTVLLMYVLGEAMVLSEQEEIPVAFV